MIFDYYIDFDYLAKELSVREGGHGAFIAGLFSRISDICTLENGRLLLDEDRRILEPLVKLQQEPSGSGLVSAERNLVVWDFLERMPRDNSIRLSNGMRISTSGGGTGPNTGKLSLRLISKKGDLRNYADFHIDQGNTIERYFGYRGIVQTERKRAACRDVQVYMFKRDEIWRKDSSDDRVTAFKEAMRSFGCAEAVKFEFFDGYGFGLSPVCDNAARDAVRILKKWLDLLQAGRTTTCLSVDVYALVPEDDIENLKNRAEAVEKLRKTFSEKAFDSRGTMEVRLCLAPRMKGASLSKAFHDRRVCSSTHSFSIGGGLDVLKGTGGECLFEIHYCGRRGKNVKEPRLDDIRSYFKDAANKDKVFVHTFTIPGRSN